MVIRQGTIILSPVIEALERVRISLPFPLRALDVDNGGEFVNEALIEYCIGHGIELTRSRLYRKNDQAWIEQKNGTVVRKILSIGPDRLFKRLECPESRHLRSTYSCSCAAISAHSLVQRFCNAVSLRLSAFKVIRGFQWVPEGRLL
jgi:hypothetical protein